MINNKRKKTKSLNFLKGFFYNKKKKKTKKIGKRKILNFFKRRYILFTSIFIIIIILGGFYFGLQKTILNEGNKIKNINFSKKSVEKYNNPYLYKNIKKSLSGKNIFFVKYFNKNKILKKIKDKYPLLKNFKILKNDKNSIAIEVKYENPSLFFENDKEKFITYNENFYSISTGDQIVSGKNSISIPEYTQNLKNFTGFFYKISEEKLKFQIEKIKEVIGNKNIKNITYLPGGLKTIVNTEKKKLYFDNKKDISKQLKQYILLKQKYDKFQDTKKIDLGSSQEIIVQ